MSEKTKNLTPQREATAKRKAREASAAASRKRDDLERRWLAAQEERDKNPGDKALAKASFDLGREWAVASAEAKRRSDYSIDVGKHGVDEAAKMLQASVQGARANAKAAAFNARMAEETAATQQSDAEAEEHAAARAAGLGRARYSAQKAAEARRHAENLARRVERVVEFCESVGVDVPEPPEDLEAA